MADIGDKAGRWLGDYLEKWVSGMEKGGVLPPRPAGITNEMIAEAKKELKADIKSGEVEVPANARGGMARARGGMARARGGMAPARGLGGDLGSTIGRWAGNFLSSWMGFAKGGTIPSKHSVFH
jgi:hypothetical protein